MTPHHERVAQHQRIMHRDARWHVHQPSPRQHTDTAPTKTSDHDAGNCCWHGCGWAFGVQNHCCESHSYEPHERAGQNHGNRWAQEMTSLVAVCRGLHMSSTELGAQRNEQRDGDEQRGDEPHQARSAVGKKRHPPHVRYDHRRQPSHCGK